jgi:chromate reductase
MTSSPKVLAFAGSARKDSFNKKLVRAAAEGVRAAGCGVTVIDLADYPLPIMDEDLEAASGLPENALKLKKLFLEHQGLLIAAPEHNSSVTALLKNAIDWVSRPVAGQPRMACFVGKAAGLVSASPGALGGLRGLVHLRAILGNIEVTVIPQQYALSKAHEAFDADGRMKDAAQKASAEAVGTALAVIVKKLSLPA